MFFLSALKTGLCLLMAAAVPAVSAMTLYMSKDDDDGHAYIIANDAMLKAEDAVKIRRFLGVQAARGIPTAIFISSPGGFGELMNQYAKAIIESSDELFRKHRLFNVIVLNDECSSACVILMSHVTNGRDPKALKIMVAPNTRFGFHSPVEVRDGAVVSIRDMAERETRIRIQIGLLAASGVNADWLQKNELMLRTSKMTFLTGEQLCVGGAGILPSDSCIFGVTDLGSLARNQLNSAIMLAQAPRQPSPVRTATTPEGQILDSMGSRPAAAPAAKAVVKPRRKGR